MSQLESARHLRQLHHRSSPLVLPNAWDPGTARLIESVGAAAIATTSAGVSWAAARPDGQGLTRAEMLELVRQMQAAVRVPLTADIEGGYGEGSVTDVEETARALVRLGAAGLNLEDSPGREGAELLTPLQQAERIRAVRAAADQAGGDLVINARTDVFLHEVGAPESRLQEVVARAAAFRAAGADCLFVPGLLDPAAIGELVQRVDLPLNVMAMPGAPTVAELAALGVRRISVGPALTLAAFATARRAAVELLQHGTYGALADRLPFGDLQNLFAPRPE